MTEKPKGAKKVAKEHIEDYKVFRAYFIEKQLLTMLVMCFCLTLYSIVAPFFIYVVLRLGVLRNLIVEFGTLFAVFGILAGAYAYLYFSKKMRLPEMTERRGVAYDIATVAVILCGACVFSVMSMYFASVEGRESGYMTFMLYSLVIVSLCKIPPMYFLFFYLIGLITVMITAMKIHCVGSDASGLYNLAIFGLLIFVLYVNKYVRELISFKQSMQIEKLQKEREKFLVSLTHEMRTPLNAVIGKNQLIMQDSQEENTLRLSKEINSSGKILLSLINDILDSSKISAGKMNIVPSEYSFSQISSEISDIMRSEAVGHGLEFVEDIGDDIPAVLYGDSVRIKQIIMNLLSNAIKYTPKGSVTFRIRCNKSTDDGKCILKVQIIDTGIGIKEEDLPYLNAEFVRLDENKNVNIQGTGLGLSITSNLLTIMGSRLSVESVYGKGSTFGFEIEQGIVATDGAATETAVEDTKPFDASALKILVVDDNYVNMIVVKGFLKNFNNDTDYAASGEECIEKLHQNKYDIVFLDHLMPVMNGVETLEKITRDMSDVRAQTTFIALTANFDSNADAAYKELGFDGYLAKPVEMGLLAKILANALKGRH